MPVAWSLLLIEECRMKWMSDKSSAGRLHTCCRMCPLWNFLICFRRAGTALRKWHRDGLPAVSLQANLPGLCAALMNCPIGWAQRPYDGLPCDVPEQGVLYAVL